MEKKVKMAAQFIKKDLRIQVLIYFILTFFLVIIMENCNIKLQYISFMNLFFIGTMFLAFYVFVHNNVFYKQILVYIFSAVFIINKFYDSQKVEKLFRISAPLFFTIVGSIVLIILFLPELSVLLGEIFRVESKSGRKSEHNKYKDNNSPNIDNRQREKKQVDSEGTIGKPISKTEKRKPDKIQTGFWSVVGNVLLTIIVMILLIAIPCILYYCLLGEAVPLFKENGEEITKNIFNSFGFYLLLIIIVGAYAIMLIKMMRLILDMLMGKKTKSEALFYSVVLFLIVLYLYREDIPLTQDSLLNLLAKGDIFSFPLALVVVVPIFFFLMEIMLDILSQDNNIVKEIKKIVSAIIKNVLISLLQVIKFITSDFLTAMVNLMIEDMQPLEDIEVDTEGEKNDREKTFEN